MKKFMYAAIATAFLGIAALAPNQAAAALVPAPVPVSAASSAAPAAGVIGVVAALVVYDLVRRTSCSGDFLALGGPGFDRPVKSGENVLPPRKC